MENPSSRYKYARAAFVPAVFGLGAITAMGLRGNADPAKPPVQPAPQALELQNAFENVAESVRPAVVFIKSRQSASALAGEEENPMFDFRIPGAPGEGNPFRNMPRRRGTASGSGVIVRNDGYIITNDHVVQDADKVTVRLNDGREFEGQVKRDFRSDIALVKINATGLPTAPFSDSNDAKVGQWAVAFGSPFGLSDTMTVGVVSSLHRNQAIGRGAEGRYYPSLIQTDASINPGNSGGPLLDIYGRILGINVAIESPSGGNVGIGFAIPANTAKYVMEQLISKGKVVRGFMGLTPKTLEYNEKQRYKVKEGVLVLNLQDGTPAAKGGIQVGDVIVRYNNKQIANEVDFREMVAKTQPGTSVPLSVLREGGEKTLNITIGTAEEPKIAQNPAPLKREARGKMGMVVGDANDAAVRRELRLQGAGQPGAIITEVVSNSAAAEAGLQTGDIVERVDGKAVRNADDLTSIVKSLSAGTHSFAIKRGNQRFLANVELE
jgi:Do/DeqQ family serine protease